MTKREQIQLSEDRKVRSVWDDEQEKWYFSIVDVVSVLTDSADPTDYLKKMRKREPELGIYIGTNCPQVQMTTHTGKMRKTLAADVEQIFRIIQSIPSPKAEPFKQWLAQVGYERVTTEVSQKEKPEGMGENVKVASRGGSVAGVARRAAEKELGHSVVSESNFLDKNPDSILIGGVEEE